jgi:hypothetical protein
MSRIFLLDKSGSMEFRIDDAIGGFNSFIREQVASGGTLSLYTFSDTCECVYRDVPIENVTQLTHETYIPSGSTALFDSMGYVLKEHKHKGVFVVLTDGQENASKKYTKAHIKDLIAASELEVIYVGCDIEEATELGVSSTVFYNGKDTRTILRLVSESVSQTVERQSQPLNVD